MEEFSPHSSAHNPLSAPQMRFGKIDDLGSRVAVAVDAARNYLFSQQHEEGYWCGELEADTTLESDYILLHALLGTGNQERIGKAARYILNQQNTDGGWNTYPGGPSHIGASVKAYFGLKLAGFAADHPALARARKKILEMGGVTEVNTFTKIYLCFFGQYDYDAVPAVPPEIVLFPNWFWFNIYEISSWSRAILVPLSICYAKKPFKKIPDEMGVEELFVGRRQMVTPERDMFERLVGGGRGFCGRAREVAHAFALGKEADFVAQFLFGAGSDCALGRACAHPASALAGPEKGREVDAGALRDERWIGRDFPVDHELHHRDALPGVLGRRSAGDSGDG